MTIPRSAAVACLLLLALARSATSQGASVADAPKSQSAAAALVSEDPDSARRAIEALLAHAAVADPVMANALLEAAARLGSAFAETWHDSVPSRSIAWFRDADLSARVAKASADSLRRAGGTALRTEGPGPALRLWRSSLREAERATDSIGVVAATTNIGVAFYTGGQPDSASGYLQAAYRLGLAIADYRAAATALGTLASIRKDGDDYRAAVDLYQKAASLHERVGDTRGLAADYNNMGLVAAGIGDTARARVSYRRALDLNRRYHRTAAAASNLLNLGTLADLQGDYAHASRLYREALEVYVPAGDSLNTGLVLQDLGRLDVRRGNYVAAIRSLTRALAIHDRIGPPDAALAVAVDLARALAATGDLPRATRALDHGERIGARSGLTDRERASLALARAELESRSNRWEAADRALSQAERYLEVSGEPGGQADALEERGLLDLQRGRKRRALDHLQLAMRARDLAGDVRAAAGTWLLLGYAAGTLGDTAAARGAYEESRAMFARIGDRIGEAEAIGVLAQLTLDQGLALSADSLYRTALARLANRPAPAAWWLHLGRGEALRARRATAEAVVELKAAIAEVERSAGAFAVPDRRAAFMADKWQPYAELAQLEQARGQPDAAFAVSERMRAQELLELLAGTLGRLAPEGSDPAAAHQLRERITGLTLRLTSGADPAVSAVYRGPRMPAGDQDAIREALADAEDKYAQLLEHARAGAPAYGWMPQPVISAPGVRGRLEAHDAFLEYLVCDTTTLVFVVTSDSIMALDLHVGRKALARLIDFARGTIGSEPEFQDQKLWRGPLQRLYRYLISPIEATGLLQDKRRLYIAPHADLHYLPFAALLEPGSAGRYLVERFSISYAPSASVWARLTPPPRPRSADRVLLLAPVSRRTLPGADLEVHRIAGLYGAEATTLRGAEASERTFRALAPEYAIVHLASFGVLNRQNPLFSYVTLQPAGDQDGRLEAQEILGLSLHARLVVLSACQTALGSGAFGDVPAGDDWIGLVQSFVSAGAAQVLATMWAVADRPTASLMTRFYQRLRAGVSEDEALAGAQRDLLGRRETSSPRHWAGFVLTGGPGAEAIP